LNFLLPEIFTSSSDFDEMFSAAETSNAEGKAEVKHFESYKPQPNCVTLLPH
jgi:hypothetical protein